MATRCHASYLPVLPVVHSEPRNVDEGLRLRDAAARGDVEALQQLLMKGDPAGALHLAAANGELLAVEALLEDGRADVDAVDSDLKTAAHRAAENGHFDVVKLLAERGIADVTALDRHGRSVSEAARHRGFTDVADKLERLALSNAPLRRWFTSEDRRIAFATHHHAVLLGRPLAPYEDDYGPIPPPSLTDNSPESKDAILRDHFASLLRDRAAGLPGESE